MSASSSRYLATSGPPDQHIYRIIYAIYDILQGRPDSGSAAEEIIGELQALFARHNAGAALSAKFGFKPTKEFHTACRVPQLCILDADLLS